MSIEEANFLNRQKFSKMVEELVSSSGVDYMDAILHLCEKYELYVEDIKKYITEPIKSKLEYEATKKRFLVDEQNFTPLE